MVRPGEIEHSARIAPRAEVVWNWASPAGRLRCERRAERIIESARLNGDSVVLELGCGTGVFTRYFASKVSRLVAIDISPVLLEQARRRLNGRVHLCLEDAEALSFEDGMFDAVIGSSVLHHVEIRPALQEAYRVLKPGGRIAFAEPNILNPQVALQRTIPAMRRWAGESPGETAFCRWMLARQLERMHYCEVRVEPFDFLHPSTPRSLIPMVRRMGRLLEYAPLVREIAGSLMISASRDGRECGAKSNGTAGKECVPR